MEEVAVETAEQGSTRAAPSGRPASRWRVWRSPPDQPAWARPALLALSAIAALSYAWGIGGAVLETFYGAAARSMSMSWHNFFFGSFDPRGTVTIDKIPGAFWLQAISLRVFGFHIWAIVLPQVLEGTVAVLVLYRAVRRLAGPLASIAAAAVLVSSPVTVALNRGNVADSLLIVLIVLAADATSAALLSGRLRTLVLAGVLVGVAFQVKMEAAWLVLPALAGAYLLAAPPPLARRLAHIAVAGLVCVLVSFSWMTAVSLVPKHDRPFVDGTQNDSPFTQTFVYNGTARLEHKATLEGDGKPAAFLVQSSQENTSPSHKVKASWHRLLSGLFGRDDGWLLPIALIAAAAALAVSRGRERTDRLRAAVVLWGGWLLLFALFFSAGGKLNSYYVAALSPATGALCGVGVELAWRERRSARARAIAAGALACAMLYGIYLLRGGTAVPWWLVPLACVLGVLGVGALLVPRLAEGSAEARWSSPKARALLVAGCALWLPAVASVLMVSRGLGPFAAPYEPASGSISRAAQSKSTAADEQVVEQLASTYSTPIVFAADTSTLAGSFIFASGQEVLPIGGYAGGIPAPTLDELKRLIAAEQVRAFLVPVISDDPRIEWIHAHCSNTEGSSSKSSVTAVALYDCKEG